MHRLFAPELLKRQRNWRFPRFVERFDGTAQKQRSLRQMLQHRCSIYIAEIRRFRDWLTAFEKL
jgi:hypothetical protein